MDDLRLSKEGNFALSSDGDAAIVSGIDCLIQDIKHRLITYPGDLWLHPEYGSELRHFLQSTDDEMTRLELQQVIYLALKDDELIDPESITVSVINISRESIRVVVTFAPSDTFETEDAPISGEVSIVLAISQNGIIIGSV